MKDGRIVLAPVRADGGRPECRRPTVDPQAVDAPPDVEGRPQRSYRQVSWATRSPIDRIPGIPVSLRSKSLAGAKTSFRSFGGGLTGSGTITTLIDEFVRVSCGRWWNRCCRGSGHGAPQAAPMPNGFIGSREHNWLTSKVLSTAVDPFDRVCDPANRSTSPNGSRLRWSARVWWAQEELNLRPLPCQQNGGNRCANRRSPRSARTVEALGKRSEVVPGPVEVEVAVPAR